MIRTKGMQTGFIWLLVAGLSLCAASACGDGELALSKNGTGGASGASGAAGSGSGGTGGCKDSGQCGGGKPFCDPLLGRCVECVDKQNCTSGQSCDPGGNCVPACASSGDCTVSPLDYCNLAYGACVECLSNADCTSGEHPICVNGRCRECQTDKDCAGQENKHYCDQTSYQCIGCLSSTNCSPGYHCEDHECRSSN